MSDDQHPPTKPPRLSADKRRAIRLRVISLTTAGQAVTTERTREIIKLVVERNVEQSFAENLLKDIGFEMSDEVEPYMGVDGSFQSSRVWIPGQGTKVLTPAEGARALDARTRVLMEAFVADLLDDRFLQFASLDDRAVEAARIFGTVMSAQVQARARFGARKILPACANVAALSFKSTGEI